MLTRQRAEAETKAKNVEANVEIQKVWVHKIKSTP